MHPRTDLPPLRAPRRQPRQLRMTSRLDLRGNGYDAAQGRLMTGSYALGRGQRRSGHRNRLAPDPEAADRAATALRLYREGGLTFREIAEAVGYASEAGSAARCLPVAGGDRPP